MKGNEGMRDTVKECGRNEEVGREISDKRRSKEKR